MMRCILVAAVLALTLAASASPQPRTIAGSTEITDPDELVGFSSGLLNTYWKWWFNDKLNRTYHRPAGIYWYTSVVETPCGPTKLNNAFYCPKDKRIWLDRNLFSYYLQTVREDFAAVAVLAHEWGHWVQDQLGWLNWARQRRYWIGRELQADCYAGMFTRYLNGYNRSGYRFLEPGDVQEGARLAVRFGDDPRMRRDDMRAHGKPRERLGWFMFGFRTGNLFACNRVYGQIYG